MLGAACLQVRCEIVHATRAHLSPTSGLKITDRITIAIDESAIDIFQVEVCLGACESEWAFQVVIYHCIRCAMHPLCNALSSTWPRVRLP